MPRFGRGIYFLPGASAEECISHYYAEKATRPSASPSRNLTDPYRAAYGDFSLLVQIDDDKGELPSTYIHRNRP
jgi:hypothetical protein